MVTGHLEVRAILLHGPVGAFDYFAEGEGGEEPVHGFLEFLRVARNGCVNVGEGEAHLAGHAEAGGEAEGVSVEVVRVVWCGSGLCSLRIQLVGIGVGHEDVEVGVDVGPEDGEAVVRCRWRRLSNRRCRHRVNARLRRDLRDTGPRF